MLALSSAVVELIGYLASGLVVLSLAMTSVVRLRIISLVGSVIFVVYGVLLDAFPIVLTNAAIAGLNVWFLSRELGGKRDLGAVEVTQDSPFLTDFIASHEQDIARFQPEFNPQHRHDYALVLTRDGLPAGMLLGTRDGDTLDITLDYVLGPYRDSRLGQWLFGPGAGVIRQAGFSKVTSLTGDRSHESYLRRVGFVGAGDRLTRTI